MKNVMKEERSRTPSVISGLKCMFEEIFCFCSRLLGINTLKLGAERHTSGSLRSVPEVQQEAWTDLSLGGSRSTGIFQSYQPRLSNISWQGSSVDSDLGHWFSI